jgi:hypothetical protein
MATATSCRPIKTLKAIRAKIRPEPPKASHPSEEPVSEPLPPPPKQYVPRWAIAREETALRSIGSVVNSPILIFFTAWRLSDLNQEGRAVAQPRKGLRSRQTTPRISNMLKSVIWRCEDDRLAIG